MQYQPVSRSAWYADGLRWIAEVCNDAADRLERDLAAPTLALEPTPEERPIDEFLYDVRFRVQHEIHFR